MKALPLASFPLDVFSRLDAPPLQLSLCVPRSFPLSLSLLRPFECRPFQRSPSLNSHLLPPSLLHSQPQQDPLLRRPPSVSRASLSPPSLLTSSSLVRHPFLQALLFYQVSMLLRVTRQGRACLFSAQVLEGAASPAGAEEQGRWGRVDHQGWGCHRCMGEEGGSWRIRQRRRESSQRD